MINKNQPSSNPQVPKKNNFSIGSLKFRPLKLSTYEKSSSRTEMPNKYRSVDAPRVNIEDVYEKNLQDQVDSSSDEDNNEQRPTTLQTQVSFPIRSFRDLKEAMSFRDSTQTRPFYYVENNEIMSVDQFFNVYKNMTVYQNKKHRASHRKNLKEKEKLIGDASTPKVKSFPHSISISPNAHTQIFETQGSTFASPKNLQLPSHRYKHSETLLTFLTQRFTFHPNISSPPSRKKSAADVLNSAKMSQGTQTQLNSPKASNLLKDFKSKSPDQKFTEKQLQKQLQWTFMSPKLIRQNTADIKKEKAYQTMFKDPKTLDIQTENKLRKAQKNLMKQASTDLPQRRQSIQFEKIFDELQLNQSFTDEEKQSPNGSVVDSPLNKDERVKKVQLVSQKIEKNIKHIDRVLRSNSPTHKMRTLKKIVSPMPLQATVSLKPKNKFPLRMDVAQKYNLGAKLQDHKTSSNKVKKIALALQKEAKNSEMKSTTYVSYYN